ncbi:MAG: DsbA family oxidoreductase, partial [Microbacterium sp.]
LNVADRDVLARLAEEVGLDRSAAVAALDSAELDRAIDDDIRTAAELGISGVPFFVLAGRYGVSGAQPVEAFAQALAQAWNER